jgi:hypothetical protein
MKFVHLFVSTGRFRSFEEMRKFIDETYTEDGDRIPSAFVQEVNLTEYDRSCIEAILSESGQRAPLSDLLAGASYAEQWLQRVEGARLADAAICVFAPNSVEQPERCSLEYLGAFPYQIT